MNRARMISRKLLQLAGVLVVVTLFTALLISFVPGDPVDVIAPFGEKKARQELREDLNLDDPLHERYVAWLSDFVSGDFGNYYTSSGKGESVGTRIREALPVSLQLLLYAQVLALVVAIP